MSLLEREPLGNTNSLLEFKKDCLNFLVKLCVEIKLRFSFNENGVIANLKVLDPKVIYSENAPVSIAPLATHFRTIVPENLIDDLDDEYRSFRMTKVLRFDEDKTIPQFWYSLRDIKDGMGQCKYQHLSKFMTNLTVLPHSSAAVERVFCQVNTIKTGRTNALGAGTTRDRILAKQHVTKHNQSCITWKPKTDLLKDIHSGRYTRAMSKR